MVPQKMHLKVEIGDFLQRVKPSEQLSCQKQPTAGGPVVQNLPASAGG